MTASTQPATWAQRASNYFKAQPPAIVEKEEEIVVPPTRWERVKNAMPSVSMPSLAFTNDVLTASAYGASAALIMQYAAPAWTVSVLTAAVTSGVSKLALNVLAEKVSKVVANTLSRLIGLAVVTAIAFYTAGVTGTASALNFLKLAGITSVASDVARSVGTAQF